MGKKLSKSATRERRVECRITKDDKARLRAVRDAMGCSYAELVRDALISTYPEVFVDERYLS